MRKLLISLCLLSVISACSTTQKNTSEPVLNEVSFGNFGGFTNHSTEYFISGDGTVSKTENNIQKTIGHLKKKEVKKITNHVKSKEFEKLKINEPGNLTYFITVKTNQYENTVRWNDETQNPVLKDTYKMLVEFLR